MRIAPLADLPDGRGVRVDAFGHRIAVFRVGGEVFALADRCSHAEASLADGELFDGAVECPRHGSEFDLRTGEPGSFPATKPVEVYAVAVEDGDVFVTLEPLEVAS
ncbi:MAG: non-heme iron oxygenase ferredoxin subunit [Actinobacteria bacterium]|nr:non-heme iron oxygenase ferredoxin subunit [Actinomycetota bacterium]